MREGLGKISSSFTLKSESWNDSRQFSSELGLVYKEEG